MKVAIISDIHDNLINLDKCLAWCKKEEIENLICCGDICNSETLAVLSVKFSGDIYLVKGNLEIYDEGETYKYKNIKYLGKFDRFELNGKIVGLCHEPYLVKKVLEEGQCDIVFCGHTHRPWLEVKDDNKIVNPGTLGGVFQKATFAVWDTKEKEPKLKVLETL